MRFRSYPVAYCLVAMTLSWVPSYPLEARFWGSLFPTDVLRHEPGACLPTRRQGLRLIAPKFFRAPFSPSANLVWLGENHGQVKRERQRMTLFF